MLNFVFRQLLQDYFTLTYLDDVTITFSNGTPNSERTVKLPQLDSLLYDILKTDTDVTEVRKMILTYLSNIYDYSGTSQRFAEKTEEVLTDLTGGTPTKLNYYRKNRVLNQTYKDKTVKGIILNVTHRTLRTPSLIVEALLGQGEALDCYNMQLQDVAVESAVLQNTKLKHEIGKLGAETSLINLERIKTNRALDMLDKVDDPIKRAELYKKVFTDCCDMPQIECNCHGKTSK